MSMRKVVQVTDTYYLREDADDALTFQREQVGFIAGRIVDNRAKYGGWTMQSFHALDDISQQCGEIMPGMRVVLVPERCFHYCEVKA
jgi:hypothetical protein